MAIKLTIDELSTRAEIANDVLEQVFTAMARPNPAKTPPIFSSAYIADLCKFDRASFHNIAKKHDLPLGEKIEGKKERTFTLKEVITWAMATGNFPVRPAGEDGRIWCSANYKGGVTKTSTAVGIAQGLALRGLKVLLADLDPQGTATALLGVPTGVIQPEDTIMPLVLGNEADLKYAVQPTYWENVSLIPSASPVLGAEFAIPGRAIKTRGYPFWKILANGLDPLRQDFDVIICDTSPSLSHITVNAMLAADGLIMPCPPETLDYASSVQFWGLFTELAYEFPNVREEKVYDFMTVIFTKTQASQAQILVKDWMKRSYGSHINGIELPDSAAAKFALAQFKTIYDIPKPEGSAEAHRRFKEPMDRLVDSLADQLTVAWSKE